MVKSFLVSANCVKCQNFLEMSIKLAVLKYRECVDQLSDFQFLNAGFLPWSKFSGARIYVA